MQILKQILNFYINSSIHVALSVYALTYITLIEFNISYDEPVLYFVFYATITGYNFVKFFGLAKFHHRSLARWLKAIQIFSLICFVLMCYYLSQLPVTVLPYILIFGLATFFYAMPIVPKLVVIDKQQTLRDIGGLKVYVIALVWSGVTVLLPIMSNDITLNDDIYIAAVQRFIFVIVLMLPFEIRDLRYDSLKLATIPQKIGVKSTKLIGVGLLIFQFMLEFFKDELRFGNIAVLGAVLFVTGLLVLFSSVNQNKYYSAFWVEGVPILWLCLMLLTT